MQACNWSVRWFAWPWHLGDKKMASSPVVVTVTHRMGRQAATQRIQLGIRQFRSSQSLIAVEREDWTGGHLDFRLSVLGQVCDGTLDIYNESVRMEIMLTGLLSIAARPALAAARKRAQVLLGTS
jgi:hypothetical protein